MAEEAVVLGEVTETIYPQEGVLPDNEELFAGYIDQTFFGDRGISLFSTSHHGAALDNAMQGVYEKLRTKVEEIAKGTTFATNISMYGLSVDFGADSVEEMKNSYTASMDLLLDCILADCPYELYWFDKTEGIKHSYSYNSKYVITSITIKFSVATAYRGESEYTTDTAKTSAATAVAAKAKEIVERHAGKSDYKKLLAYYEEICALTSYNFAAIEDETTEYGDPWQLIYVFDDNPETNVVCEGYSKAFQYLCELSTFDEEVYCYSIIGEMTAGEDSQLHMWNHVSIDGANYMVDVTNSDEGSIGAGGGLFMKGMEGSIASGYSKTLYSVEIRYTYGEENIAMFGDDSDSILFLSPNDYEESTIYKVTISAQEEIPWGYKKAATLSSIVTLAQEAIDPPSYQWYRVDYSSGSRIEEKMEGATDCVYVTENNLEVGEYIYCVQVTQGKWTKKADVCFRVNPLTLTAQNLEFTKDIITKTYDGTTTSDAKVRIKAGVVAKEAIEIPGTAKYNSAEVNIADKVIFVPVAIESENYTLADTEIIEHSATITKRMTTQAPKAPEAVSITDDMVILKEVEGCEYSLDGIAWQNYPEFTGLDYATNYTFYQRVAESDNTVASEPGPEMMVTTLAKGMDKLDVELILPEQGYIYDRSCKTPEVLVKEAGNVVEKQQYKVSYSNNTDAGAATVRITASEDGRYSGMVETNFFIAPKTVEVMVLGTTHKVYDKTTDCDGNGLQLLLDGVYDTDNVTAVADYVYEDAGVGTGKNITIYNMQLEGSGAQNYILMSSHITVPLGEIRPASSSEPANTKDPGESESPQPTDTKKPQGSESPQPTDTKEPQGSESPQPMDTKEPQGSESPLPVNTKEPEIQASQAPTFTENLGSQENKSILQLGQVIKDSKTNGIYQIENYNSKEKTLIYKAPLQKDVVEITIPSSMIIAGEKFQVTTIKGKAFRGCKNLKVLILGKSVRIIRKNAFKGCKSLRLMEINTKKLNKKTVGKNAFKGVCKNALIVVPAKKYKAYKKLLRLKGVKKTVLIKK